MNARDTLKDIFSAAIKAVDPYRSTLNKAPLIREEYQKGAFTRLQLAGFGKAAVPMAKALEDSLGDLISEGTVITKYGHNFPAYRLNKIKVWEAGHPVPDQKGLEAARDLIKMLKGADRETLVVCLISGGGSALLTAPSEGISLADKQETTRLLLSSGADIEQLNTVRKHLSAVKGGQLAQIIYPGRTIALMISDVVGDSPAVIASGPVSPDPATYADALAVLKRLGLEELVPAAVTSRLKQGEQGLKPETPKPGDPIFNQVTPFIIADNRKAREAAGKKAQELGIAFQILPQPVTGEAREAGIKLAEKILKKPEKDFFLISGGETTVTVKGKGLGGRNLELALAFAGEIESIKGGVTLLSAGTDGADGPTDAAGAIVDERTVSRGKALGLNPRTFLNRNDSYPFLEKTGDLLITGPTGTNVMDIQLILKRQP